MPMTPLVIAVVILGGAASAQQPQPAADDKPIIVTGERPEDQRKVCKDVNTGSLFRKRVCMTKADWDRMGSDSQDTLKDLRDWQRVRCNFGTRC